MDRNAKWRIRANPLSSSAVAVGSSVELVVRNTKVMDDRKAKIVLHRCHIVPFYDFGGESIC